MFDPATAKQLADAGGWAAFLVVCGLLAVGFGRQWFVPGWLYRSQEKRTETLITQLERNTDALARLTASVDRLRNAQRDRPGRPDAGP